MATLASLARRLSLKPYGDELLTRSADFWLFSARLIILTMALAEGIAWGYMGALMSRAYPWLAAAIAGLFVFTLVWIIDATFMTLDLSRGFYERHLLGTEENPRKEKLKLVGGIAARVAIVSASLFITAPFLAQAIFAADVEDEMTRRNASAVASKRIELEQPFTARLAALQRDQQRLEQQRVAEAAGVGPSGKYGRGPALETIERQLTDKRNEIANVEATRAATLAGFDKLTPSQLEQQHGIRFLAPGVQSSGELLGDMMKRPEFTGAELAVRAFLAFLFLGLLILKVFQPRSVAVYFNEQLHSVHDEYRKGLFDEYLPAAEHGGTMEPLRFEDWCLNTYSVIRKEDARRRDTAREYRMHELLVEQWHRLGTTARAELDPLLQRHASAAAAIDELEAELHRATTAGAAADEELRTVTASHDSMRQHLDRGGMNGPTFEQAIAAANELDDRRRALTQTLRETTRAVETTTRRLDLRRSEAASLQREIEAKQRVIADADRAIGDERLRLASVIERQRENWSRPAPAHL